MRFVPKNLTKFIYAKLLTIVILNMFKFTILQLYLNKILIHSPSKWFLMPFKLYHITITN